MQTKIIILHLITNLPISQVKDTLSVSALELTKQEVTYDPGYSFPSGFYILNSNYLQLDNTYPINSFKL